MTNNLDNNTGGIMDSYNNNIEPGGDLPIISSKYLL